MKVFLLQLPLQSHDFFFSHENIPLAPAYLQVIAKQQGIDAELLPRPLMSYGSDQAILQFLLEARPDLVGLSCYQWNIERTLYLAKQVKQLLPTCTIVLGGPEITTENGFLLRHTDFDVGVVGEGEEVWSVLLQSFPKIPPIPGLLLRGENGQWHDTGRQHHPPPLGQWPSPFLSGLLDSQLKGVLWLETVRGCIHRCTYCYYHKKSPLLRTFPLERICKEVERALNEGLEEIVFLDPCFSIRPDLETLLEGLATANPKQRLRLHAECTVEAIDQGLAEKMARAGFVQFEVGLQSTNRTTLRNIHRTFHPQRFLRGIRALQASGIEVMVDLIAGLPGDGLSDICKSLDWVIDHEAYDYLMLYPLSLIPGTELRHRASQLGLSAMPNPPYLLTRSPTITALEMKRAFHYYEESMEEEVTPLEVPPFFNGPSDSFALPEGLRYRVDWNRLQQIEPFSRSEHTTAYALTVSMEGEVLKEPRLWVPVLKDYLEKNPFSLFSIEVPPDTFPEELLPVWQLAQAHSHPVDRDYTVIHSPYRSFIVLSRSKGLLWKWPDPRESAPVVLPDGQKVFFEPICRVVTPGEEIPKWFIDHIRQRYSSPPEIKRWQPPED
ncbi:MAG: B12-binding domain-containing radical SAM protein [Thermodesulfobacteriota bacterium]